MFHLIQYEFKIIHFIWVVCMLKKAQMRTYNPFFFSWGALQCEVP